MIEPYRFGSTATENDTFIVDIPERFIAKYGRRNTWPMTQPLQDWIHQTFRGKLVCATSFRIEAPSEANQWREKERHCMIFWTLDDALTFYFEVF